MDVEMNANEQIENQRQCFLDFDVDEYEVLATLDKYTCPKCAAMDKKHFPMKNFKIGVTAPPFHKDCRCAIAPYFADKSSSSRAARDRNGKSILVSSDMTYKDWKAIYLDKSIL